MQAGGFATLGITRPAFRTQDSGLRTQGILERRLVALIHTAAEPGEHPVETEDAQQVGGHTLGQPPKGQPVLGVAQGDGYPLIQQMVGGKAGEVRLEAIGLGGKAARAAVVQHRPQGAVQKGARSAGDRSGGRRLGTLQQPLQGNREMGSQGHHRDGSAVHSHRRAVRVVPEHNLQDHRVVTRIAM